MGRTALLAGLAALVLGACATPQPGAAPPASPAAAPAEGRHAVILLADPDGSVGRVSVTNAAGTRTLERPGEATHVVDAATAPGEPRVLSAEEIRALVGEALDAQPAPPAHFTLYFERDSAELTVDSRRELDAVVAAIRERGSLDTSVTGHTDTAGDARDNEALGLRRASAVGALLTAAGVDPATLQIASHGEAVLLVPTADGVVEPRNRRVEVTVR